MHANSQHCSLHAPPQGYFYYFLDIGRAVLACTDPTIIEHAPSAQFSMDADTKSAGLDGINLLMWRWLCATGVYHAGMWRCCNDSNS